MAYVNLYYDKKFNKIIKMIKSFTNVFGFIDDRRAWDVVCQGFENRLQISLLMQINAMLLGARKIFVNTANISI